MRMGKLVWEARMAAAVVAMDGVEARQITVESVGDAKHSGVNAANRAPWARDEMD